MKPASTPVNFAPPLVRHVIRGTRTADVPVSGIEVLMHRHVRLKEWHLCNAADAYWRCYWPMSLGGEIIFRSETHPLIPGWLYLIAPHTGFHSHCARSFRKWYIHFTLSGPHPPYGPGIIRIRPTGRMRHLLRRTCPVTTTAHGSQAAVPKALATI